MYVVSQGTAGAGKTTALQSMEADFGDEATYIPELILDIPPEPNDEYFFANDRAKLVAARNAELALVDRDGLSTLGWIATRDGANSLNYREAHASYKEAVANGEIDTPDLYFHFSVPFEVSAYRQSPNNHPLWRDKEFVDTYERTIDGLIADLIPNAVIHSIDGLMSKEDVFQACKAAILDAKRRQVPPKPQETPYIDYHPRSFIEYKEADALRQPLACVVLKPDCVERGLVDQVSELLTEQGVTIVARTLKHLSRTDVLQLWSTFWTESWWQDTFDYMSSSPSMGLLCTFGNQGITNYDELTAAKRKIRERFKDPFETNPTVSMLHTSDCHEETMRNVLAFWSPQELGTILRRTDV